MRVQGVVAFLALALACAPLRAEAQNADPAPAFSDGQEFDDCNGAGWCPRMVVIPAGGFLMGAPASEVRFVENDMPQHTVSIDRFAVGKYEVTRGEWAQFVRATRHVERDVGRNGFCTWRDPYFVQDDRHPVVCVPWQDARDYTAWLSRRTGQTYRLLTESEWEYAARAGSTTVFSWGSSIRPEQAQYSWSHPYPDSPTLASEPGGTASVGSFSPNAFGLYDMHGNVREWVEDCWNDTYDGAPTNGTVWTSGNCSIRVLRGGSWYTIPQLLRAAHREAADPISRSFDFGFRVARGVSAAEREGQ